jgi:hypothetical protein
LIYEGGIEDQRGLRERGAEAREILNGSIVFSTNCWGLQQGTWMLKARKDGNA